MDKGDKRRIFVFVGFNLLTEWMVFISTEEEIIEKSIVSFGSIANGAVNS